MDHASEQRELRRAIWRRPITWVYVVAGVAVLGVTFFAGDHLDVLTPAATDQEFDAALVICTDVETELHPTGIYREDLRQHFTPAQECLLIAAQHGREQFSKTWNDPEWVKVWRQQPPA